MALFKSGNRTNDQYASYTTEQLIDIVTDKTGKHSPDEVEAARRILLVRGHDYRTKEQKAADQQATAQARTHSSSTSSATTFATPRVRVNRQRPSWGSSGGTGLKTWHWIWIILMLVRAIACLTRHN